MTDDKPYTRIVVCTVGETEETWAVMGYRRGVFHPLGKFQAAGEAVEFALTLPVKDPRNPVNVKRGPLI